MNCVTCHATKKNSLFREHRHQKLGVFHIKMFNRHLLVFLSGFRNFPYKDKEATAVQ